MKKLFLVLAIQTVVIIAILAQPVSDYNYKLNNGVNVKLESCWNQVWVQQSYSPIKAGNTTPLVVNIRTLGDLISNSSFKLIKGEKEVDMKGAAPGTYDLKLTFTLSGYPGTLGFNINNVLIKANNQTSISITLYDYQVLIDATPASLRGLTSFETMVNRCKGNTIQDMYYGLPIFYEKGNHAKAVTPSAMTDKTSGTIKPGTYDLLISIGISGQTHKVWLENFTFKPDTKYKISTNLNAGGIVYSGSNKEINAMQLYPAGTSARQTSQPMPVKNLEIIRYETVNITNCCSPGTYDVLLNYDNGSKYEWRKNIAVQTGTRTEVK